MGKRKRLTTADLAREAGLTESETIARLRRNGMKAYEGWRLSTGDLQRARGILFCKSDDAEPLKDNITGCEAPSDERVGIHDVVSDWLAKNPGPKHVRVAGRTYDDFIHSHYRFNLIHASKRGARSTDIVVRSGDRQQIESSLNRCKSLWEKQLQKEEVKAVARRQAEKRHQAEKKHCMEELNRSEQERQFRLLQEDTQRLEEKQRQDDVRWNTEERRTTEEWQRQDVQPRVELAAHDGEQTRRERILSLHRQAVVYEGKRLADGQCSWADYYAFVLRNRIERSAELLFGSAHRPGYELLRSNPDLLEKLKRSLSFADDQHPGDYQDPYVSAYYALRYELGYAFEYSQIYGLLLGIMRLKRESDPLDVLSIGSGQGLDYWGLCYALSKQETYWPRIGWHGVDLEKWPDHILDDGAARYSDGVDVREMLSKMCSLDTKVLMFPKVLSELPYEVISFIASWLECVTFTRDVHYLCFAHTEGKSLDPSDWKHKGSGDCFNGAVECSLDAVKSATLISAACNGASKHSYRMDVQWYDPNAMSVKYYNVAWPSARNGKGSLCQYPYP